MPGLHENIFFLRRNEYNFFYAEIAKKIRDGRSVRVRIFKPLRKKSETPKILGSGPLKTKQMKKHEENA